MKAMKMNKYYHNVEGEHTVHSCSSSQTLDPLLRIFSESKKDKDAFVATTSTFTFWY